MVDRPEFLHRMTDELSELMQGPGFEGVYFGPWWESPVTAPPASGGPTVAWKCAVLRRRPEGGAEHWGHLFLIPGADGAQAKIQVEQVGGVRRMPFGTPVAFVTGPAATPFTLVARPIATGPESPIVELARRVAARLGPTPRPATP